MIIWESSEYVERILLVDPEGTLEPLFRAAGYNNLVVTTSADETQHVFAQDRAFDLVATPLLSSLEPHVGVKTLRAIRDVESFIRLRALRAIPSVPIVLLGGRLAIIGDYYYHATTHHPRIENERDVQEAVSAALRGMRVA